MSVVTGRDCSVVMVELEGLTVTVGAMRLTGVV